MFFLPFTDRLYLNQGGFFSAAITLTDKALPAGTVMDVNGDGMMDVLSRAQDAQGQPTGNWYILLSNGVGFDRTDTDISATEFTNLHRFAIDGSPNSAVIGSSTDGFMYAFHSHTPRPEVLGLRLPEPLCGGRQNRSQIVRREYIRVLCLLGR